ncbi:hypothetical protein ACB092_04G059600 [Castanea dentata]
MSIQDSSLELEIVIPKTATQGGNFSVEEDILLVSTWLNTSVDPVRGNEQKQETFTAKVWQYFCMHNTYGTKRSSSSLKSRWSTINKKTSKFCGFVAKIEAKSQSDASDKDKLDQAKALYKDTSGFQFEHCWLLLKNQPKWSVPKERSKGLPQTSSSIGEVRGGGGGADNTTEFERPIGKKAKKANQKSKDADKDFGEYLAKTFHYIEEAHEQEKEALRIKAKNVQVDEERIGFEKERIQVDEEIISFEMERLRIQMLKEEERIGGPKIMMMDTSGMTKIQRTFFEKRPEQILARLTDDK